MTTLGLEHLLGRVSRSLELTDVLSELLRAARELAGTERNVVLLCDADGSLVRIGSGGGRAQDLSHRRRIGQHQFFDVAAARR